MKDKIEFCNVDLNFTVKNENQDNPVTLYKSLSLKSINREVSSPIFFKNSVTGYEPVDVKSPKNEKLEDYCLKECVVVINDLIKEDDDIKTPTIVGRTICAICNKDIKNSYYKRHLASHKRSVKCDKCQVSYTHKGFGVHKCIKSFRCEPCGKNYPCQEKLETHLRYHDQIEKRKITPKTVFCPHCKKEIKKNIWKRHEKIHAEKGPILHKMPKSTKPKKYICPICGKDCVKKQRYIKHERFHENQNKHQCKECQQTFPRLIWLYQHISDVHRDTETGKTRCPICDKEYTSISSHLQSHSSKPPAVTPAEMRSKIPKKPKTFTCPQCSEQFPNVVLCIKHINKHHIISTNYLCPFCDMDPFKSVSELSQHVSRSHFSLPRFVTNQGVLNSSCDKDEHLSRTHQNGILECEICDRSFDSSKEFADHYKRFHKLVKEERIVNILMSKYAARSNHNKVACLRCHAKIRISRTIHHLQSHQTFKCITCQKRFFDDASLERHERQHTLRHSMRCPVCHLCFLSHVRLLAHLRMRHKMGVTVSKACSRCQI